LPVAGAAAHVPVVIAVLVVAVAVVLTVVVVPLPSALRLLATCAATFGLLSVDALARHLSPPGCLSFPSAAAHAKRTDSVSVLSARHLHSGGTAFGSLLVPRTSAAPSRTRKSASFCRLAMTEAVFSATASDASTNAATEIRSPGIACRARPILRSSMSPRAAGETFVFGLRSAAYAILAVARGSSAPHRVAGASATEAAAPTRAHRRVGRER
jgi:hypothetical protein